MIEEERYREAMAIALAHFDGFIAELKARHEEQLERTRREIAELTREATKQVAEAYSAGYVAGLRAGSRREEHAP